MFDLQHFDYLEDFSAEELASLMIEVDPRDLGQSVSFQTIEPLARRIESDYSRARETVKMLFVMHGGDELQEKLKTTSHGLFSTDLQNSIDNYYWMDEPKAVIDWIMSKASNLEWQRFGRKAIVTWLNESNLKSKYNFGQHSMGVPAKQPDVNWPWGNHTTQDLEDLKAAALHCWNDYKPEDPATAPKNETVIHWLMSERGTVQEKAKNIASILRPKDLKSGPRVRNATKK